MKPGYLQYVGLLLAVLVMSLPVTFAETLSLQYDANGNLVTGDGKFRVYNSLNQLSKIYNGSSESGTLLEEFTYHPIEERILTKKTYNSSGSVIETVIYVDENFVRVVNTSGTYDFTYVKHEGQLVGQKNPDGSIYFFHDDHLGSTSVVTNSAGSVVESTTYSPYGEVLSGGTTSRFDYTGKEYDGVVGDYDFNARKYKAEWGIFLQPDKTLPSVYDPQQLNRYTYARNNPYNFIDPTGRAAFWIHYQDTYQSYRTAGFSAAEARQVAAGSVEPDLYRLTQSDNLAARSLGYSGALFYEVDLKMEHEGDYAEAYYHIYDQQEDGPLAGMTPEEHIKQLEEEYGDATKKWDLQAMGNIEHALGGDIGVKGIPGYHTGADEFNKIQTTGGIRIYHHVNDVFGIGVSRQALIGSQIERAKVAATWRPGDPIVKVRSGDQRSALQRYWARVKSKLSPKR